MASRLRKMISERFSVEIDEVANDENPVTINNALNSQEFINSLIQFYTDNTKGFELFLSTLLQSTRNIMQEDIRILTLYYILFGTFLIICLSFLLFLWIWSFNKKLIHLRLALLNIP
jgi:hypothetical protein